MKPACSWSKTNIMCLYSTIKEFCCLGFNSRKLLINQRLVIRLTPVQKCLIANQDCEQNTDFCSSSNEIHSYSSLLLSEFPWRNWAIQLLVRSRTADYEMCTGPVTQNTFQVYFKSLFMWLYICIQVRFGLLDPKEYLWG